MTESAPQKGGLYAALRFTGIPPSWLEKRPKLPSRNWLIFIGVVGSLATLYVDDRRKCKQIREEYISKVRHLAEEPLGNAEWGRKVKVYSCRYPEDQDHERTMKYFKKYVKPIFVAAAIDFDIINGNHYGALTNKIVDDIKKRRREMAGLEKSHDELLQQVQPLRGDRAPAARQKRELEGGTVIIGRHTLKEYMEGLRRGWSESMMPRDVEEEFAQTLSDEPFADQTIQAQDGELPSPSSFNTSSPLSPPSNVLNTNQKVSVFGQLQRQQPSKPIPVTALDVPPASIPPQPAFGLIPYTSHLGFKQVPYMIYDFFTERYRVRSGAEAAFNVVMGQKRPFRNRESEGYPSDLDFDKQSEQYIKTSWRKLPKRIEDAKKEYYKELPAKVKVARELAYGEREPTRSEKANPPATEVELRSQRLKKELKWKEDLEGWQVLRDDVHWDDRFEGVLEVYMAPDLQNYTQI
ncbi:Mitochondrial import inner membrane translocase subunit TIM54 [Serendipita indica DSM 11827]|nr:Mitochondrial import inner membrane translocase subunit TIM54 [Serendipita indica DSM 11827]